MREKGLQGGTVRGNPQNELENGKECLFAVCRQTLKEQYHELLEGCHERLRHLHTRGPPNINCRVILLLASRNTVQVPCPGADSWRCHYVNY